MFSKFRPSKVGAAMAEGIGSPVLDVGRRFTTAQVKVYGGIIVAGIAAVSFASNFDPAKRGHWPAVFAGATVLALLAYRFHADRRLLWAIVASWPVVAIVAWSLAQSPGADTQTANLSTLANSQTMLRTDQLVDFIGYVGTKAVTGFVHDVVPWVWNSVVGLVSGLVNR